jgi:hypothetical protein
VQAQVDALRHAEQGLDARVGRLEESIAQRETQLTRLQELAVTMQQDQTRLTHLLSASEERYSEELPELRKAAADQETLSRDLQGQVADVLVQLQRA